MRRFLPLLGLLLVAVAPASALAAGPTIHPEMVVHQRADQRVELTLGVDHDRGGMVHYRAQVRVLDGNDRVVAEGRQRASSRAAGTKHTVAPRIVLSRHDSGVVRQLMRKGGRLRARVDYRATIAGRTLKATAMVMGGVYTSNVAISQGSAGAPINVVVTQTYPSPGQPVSGTNCQTSFPTATILQVGCDQGTLNLVADGGGFSETNFSSTNVSLGTLGQFGGQLFEGGGVQGTLVIVNGQVTQMQLSGSGGSGPLAP